MRKTACNLSVPMLIAVCTQYVCAQGFHAPTVSGKIGYSYESEKVKNSIGPMQKEDLFLQEYEIDMDNGSIYSPNLMSYDLMGLLKIEDVDYDTGGHKRSYFEYRTNAEFLKKTNIPFRIWALNYTTTTESDTAGYLETVTEDYGLNGSVQTDVLSSLNYLMSSTTTTIDGALLHVERDLQRYLVTASKRKEKVVLNFSHEYRDHDEKREDYLTTLTTADGDITNTTTLDVQSDISNSVKFDASFDYRDYRDKTDINSSVIDISTLAKVNWRPSNVFFADMQVFSNNVEYEDGNMQFTSVSAASRYRISKELTTLQNISMLTSTSSYGSETALNSVSLGIYHSKGIEVGQYHVQLTNSIMGTNTDSQSNGEDTRTDSLQYRGNASSRKYLENIDADLSVTGEAVVRSQSDEEKEVRASAAVTLHKLSKITTGVTWDNSASLSHVYAETGENNTNKRLRSILKGTYNRAIGIRGRLQSYVSLLYDKTQLVTEKRVEGNADVTYLVMRSMKSTTAARVYKNLNNDQLTYSMQTALDYRLRRIVFSCSLRYAAITGIAEDYTRTNMYFKIARYF